MKILGTNKTGLHTSILSMWSLVDSYNNLSLSNSSLRWSTSVSNCLALTESFRDSVWASLTFPYNSSFSTIKFDRSSLSRATCNQTSKITIPFIKNATISQENGRPNTIKSHNQLTHPDSRSYTRTNKYGYCLQLYPTLNKISLNCKVVFFDERYCTLRNHWH